MKASLSAWQPTRWSACRGLMFDVLTVVSGLQREGEVRRGEPVWSSAAARVLLSCCFILLSLREGCVIQSGDVHHQTSAPCLLSSPAGAQLMFPEPAAALCTVSFVCVCVCVCGFTCACLMLPGKCSGLTGLLTHHTLILSISSRWCWLSIWWRSPPGAAASEQTVDDAWCDIDFALFCAYFDCFVVFYISHALSKTYILYMCLTLKDHFIQMKIQSSCSHPHPRKKSGKVSSSTDVSDVNIFRLRNGMFIIRIINELINWK